MFGKAYKLKIKAQKPKQKPREHMHFPSDICIFKNAYAALTHST